MRRALVTGATGQVGRHVTERLLQDGWSVRALVRDASRASWLKQAGVEVDIGDVLDADSFTRAANGCDVVVHAAAAITDPGGWEAYRRPNIDGTRHAIAAASAAGARLVHVSSVAVYGGTGRYASGAGGTTEDSPLGELGERSFYARSKRESEALVMNAHAEGRVWATAVRPDVIYGPYDRQFVPRLARILRRGFVPLIGNGKARLAVVHGANVADGIVRAATSDVAGGRAYNIANDFDVTAEQFFRWGCEGLGVTPHLIRVPYVVAKVGLAAFRVVSRFIGGGRFGSASSASLDFLTQDNPFNSDRARRELGWDPRVRPETSVREAFAAQL